MATYPDTIDPATALPQPHSEPHPSPVIDPRLRQTISPSAMPSATPASSAPVPVDIYDGLYHLRGTDPAYIERLAHIVDSKMRAVSAHGNTVDSLRVAVLAALNLADELESLRERYDQLAGSMSQSQRSLLSRAGSLAHLLDEVLSDSPTRNEIRNDVRNEIRTDARHEVRQEARKVG